MSGKEGAETDCMIFFRRCTMQQHLSNAILAGQLPQQLMLEESKCHGASERPGKPAHKEHQDQCKQ